jgi:hypothetical protein
MSGMATRTYHSVNTGASKSVHLRPSDMPHIVEGIPAKNYEAHPL